MESSTDPAERTVPFVGGVFQCVLCDKGFSGPAPYMQHLKSAKHLKKEETKSLSSLLVKSHMHTSSGGTAPIDHMTIFVKSCEICNVAFTGPESSAQHFEGKKHRKSLERKQILQKLNQYSRSSVTGAGECDISLSSASPTPGSSSMSSTAGSTSVSSAIPLTSTGLASMSSTTTMTSMLPMVAPCSVPSVSSTATLSSNGQRFDLAHLSASLQDANPSTYPQTTVTRDSVVSLSSSTPLANCIAQTVEPTSVHINPVNFSPRMCSSDIAISPFKESAVGCKSEALLATQSDIVSSATGNICNPLSYDMEAPNITFMDNGSGVQKGSCKQCHQELQRNDFHCRGEECGYAMINYLTPLFQNVRITLLILLCFFTIHVPSASSPEVLDMLLKLCELKHQSRLDAVTCIGAKTKSKFPSNLAMCAHNSFKGELQLKDFGLGTLCFSASVRGFEVDSSDSSDATILLEEAKNALSCALSYSNVKIYQIQGLIQDCVKDPYYAAELTDEEPNRRPSSY